jgi:hypothetical protein
VPAVGVSIAIQLAIMAVSAGLAAVTSIRGWRALRSA